MKNFWHLLFNKPDEDTVYIPSVHVIFALKIDDLVIGYLSMDEGMWTFRYSEEFKKQDRFRRLAGFSNLDKIYKSEVLWPFFKIRIPGLKQPMIKEIINDEKLDVKDEVSLLRRFGHKTMSNPYTLEPA